MTKETKAVQSRRNLGEMPNQVRFDSLCERIEAGFADVPEYEGVREIDVAVAEERARMSAQPGS